MITDNFTREELNRIDVLYGTDFEDVTRDDIPLIRRYEHDIAYEEAFESEKMRALKERNAATLNSTKEQLRIAEQIAKDRHEAIMARYKEG